LSSAELANNENAKFFVNNSAPINGLSILLVVGQGLVEIVFWEREKYIDKEMQDSEWTNVNRSIRFRGQDSIGSGDQTKALGERGGWGERREKEKE
jgi:hypothetical protein